MCYSGANARFFSSSSFSHINSSGAPTMVDISQKPSTHRSATSIGFLKLPVEMQPFLDTDSTSDTEIFTGKGPVFSTAIIAGTMAVKKTSEIIPFCHPLLIKSCKFDIALEKEYSRIRVTCTVKVEGNTGVEMEALTGVSSALLCIYDMLKAKSHQMVISDISLVSKTGGKSDINGDALKGNS